MKKVNEELMVAGVVRGGVIGIARKECEAET
jgi:hypothetical protein